VKEINLERLQDLVLARLSVGGKKPPKPSDVTKVLYPLVKRRLTQPEWKRLFERVLTSLRAAKWVDAERLVMTAAGADRLEAALGLKSPPAAKDWKAFKSKYLSRLAFAGLPGGGEAVKPSVALLAQRLGVEAGAKSTPAQIVDAWLLGTLGLPSNAKLDLNALRGALLARELGLPARTLSTVVGVAAATLSGATQGKDDAVADALTSRWLFDEPAPSSRRAPARRPAPSPVAAVAPIERIAAKALQAADGPDARQYGPNKVFIGSVWRALADDPEIAGLDEATFKHQLAEAHRRGLLKLGRADLVAAMDPSEVSASEIVHQNATYHFILRGASA
jgi:hypothetical protein